MNPKMDEFSVGIIHFVQTDDAGSTIDKCAYQRLIGATERGSRKCFLKTLPIVHQNWLQPNETVTLPSGAGNFTNKRAKKVPPPPPPLSIPELREFLDEGFLLLGPAPSPAPKGPQRHAAQGRSNTSNVFTDAVAQATQHVLSPQVVQRGRNGRGGGQKGRQSGGKQGQKGNKRNKRH